MYLLGCTSAVPVPIRDSIVTAMVDRGSTAVVSREANHTTARIRETNWELSVDEPGADEVLSLLAPRCSYCLATVDANWSWSVLDYKHDRLCGDVLPAPTDPSDANIHEILDTVEQREPFETLESLIAQVNTTDRAPYAGAIATFTGRVRELEEADDVPTDYLEFERYDPVASDRLASIRADLLARDGVEAVRFHHRTGRVTAGEDIVFVVVLAGHRTEAFRAVEDGINRLKAEVPIFKKEVTIEEEFWVHTRP